MTAGGAPNAAPRTAAPRTAAKVSYSSSRSGRTDAVARSDSAPTGSLSNRSSMKGCEVSVVSPWAAARPTISASGSPRNRMLQGSPWTRASAFSQSRPISALSGVGATPVIPFSAGICEPVIASRAPPGPCSRKPFGTTSASASTAA